MTGSAHYCWVELDETALRDNVRALRAALSPRTEILMVVKADAYGHGLEGVVRRARGAGVRYFAVAHLHEAETVRRAAPDAEVLIVGPLFPEEVAPALRARAAAIVADRAHGHALAAAARAAGGRLPVHLKVDTGMGRIGFYWQDAVQEVAPLMEEPSLDIVGVCSHFARVERGADPSAVRQFERFRAVFEALQDRLGKPLFRHISNSAACGFHPEWDLEAVRPGIVLYGYGARGTESRFQTRPILQWKTRVIQVRRVPAGFAVGYDGTYVTPAPTGLAILAVGYAEGYRRALSGKGAVLIGGRRCPVRGRVSMNWIAVEVGPDAKVAVGDEAVLIGRQGNEAIWADELAQQADTIPYEILTGIHSALPRLWIAGVAADPSSH